MNQTPADPAAKSLSVAERPQLLKHCKHRPQTGSKLHASDKAVRGKFAFACTYNTKVEDNTPFYHRPRDPRRLLGQATTDSNATKFGGRRTGSPILRIFDVNSLCGSSTRAPTQVSSLDN